MTFYPINIGLNQEFLKYIINFRLNYYAHIKYETIFFCRGVMDQKHDIILELDAPPPHPHQGLLSFISTRSNYDSKI